MARRRRQYSVAERTELRERWKRGESISDIGRALDRAPGTIHYTIRQYGGVAPPERRRSRLALTAREREEISRGVAVGESARRIAARLGRSPSTVSRELARHGGRRRYRAAEADRRAWQTTRRPQLCKLARDSALSRLVAAKLREDWSPEQIAGWLKARYPDDQTMRVSHETIYLTLFIQAREARVDRAPPSDACDPPAARRGVNIDERAPRLHPLAADQRIDPTHPAEGLSAAEPTVRRMPTKTASTTDAASERR